MTVTQPPNKNNSLTYAAGDVLTWVGLPNVGMPVGFEDPNTILAATFACLGWIDVSGYLFKLDETTKDIGAAGTLSSIRTILTGGMKSSQFTCLEALNPYVRALFDDVPVFPIASSPLKPAVTPPNIAQYTIPDPPLDNRYSMIFDSTDGLKHQRLYAPNVKVTARGDDIQQQADIESLQMTASFYPGTIGTGVGVAKRYIDYGQDVSVYFPTGE